MRTTVELLSDLLDHIERAEKHSELSYEKFEGSTERDAVIYNMIIMGEIVKLLPEEIREKHSDYPWSEVARFRDRSIHYYHRTNDRRVWEVLTERLPVLKAKVQQLLAELGSPDEGD